MRITRVAPVTLGYRKADPPMMRSFALVRIETDTGLVGWGEASTNWGHSYPTVFAAAIRDVCAPVLVAGLSFTSASRETLITLPCKSP